MDKLFLYPGRYFFDIWRVNNLGPSIGFPAAQSYSAVSGTNNLELPFQKGAMQIQQPPSTLCYRIFSNEDLAVRAAGNCRMLPNCPKKRSPTREECGPEDDPDSCGPVRPGGHHGHDDDPENVSRMRPDSSSFSSPHFDSAYDLRGWLNYQDCDQNAINQRNNDCKARQKAWQSLDAARAWNCNTGVVVPKPVPDGCPTDCQLVTQIPPTAKPCKMDNPPDGCFDTKEHNDWCRSERKRCGAWIRILDDDMATNGIDGLERPDVEYTRINIMWFRIRK